MFNSRKGLTKLDLSKFTKMLMIAENRGDMATGIGRQDMYVWKMPVTASKAVLGDILDNANHQRLVNFILGAQGHHYIIGHTRHATQGTPSDNENNHPVKVRGYDAWVVHNGVVDTDAFPVDNSKTDTIIIAEAIARNWTQGDLFTSVQRAFSLFWGNANVLVISPTEFVAASRNTWNNALMVGVMGPNVVYASQGVLTYEVSRIQELKNGWLIGHKVGEHRAKSGRLPPPRERATSYRTYVSEAWAAETMGQTTLRIPTERELAQADRIIKSKSEEEELSEDQLVDSGELEPIEERSTGTEEPFATNEQIETATVEPSQKLTRDELEVLEAIYGLPASAYAGELYKKLGSQGFKNALMIDRILQDLLDKNLIIKSEHGNIANPSIQYSTSHKGRKLLGKDKTLGEVTAKTRKQDNYAKDYVSAVHSMPRNYDSQDLYDLINEKRGHKNTNLAIKALLNSLVQDGYLENYGSTYGYTVRYRTTAKGREVIGIKEGGTLHQGVTPTKSYGYNKKLDTVGETILKTLIEGGPWNSQSLYDAVKEAKATRNLSYEKFHDSLEELFRSYYARHHLGHIVAAERGYGYLGKAFPGYT